MAITAKLYYLRIAPRKVRLVADLIKGKSVEEAQTILKFTVKKATQPILKLLKSAIANAKNNFQIHGSNLYISKIIVDEGPKSKRWRARARGRAFEIQKKTSHIILCLDEISKEKPRLKKTRKAKEQKTIKKTAPPQEIIEKNEKARDKEEEKTPETIQKTKKLKFTPWFKSPKPKIDKSFKKIFRRKSF